MEVPKLDRQRVTDGEPGFELRGITFFFTPTGSPDEYAAIFNSDTDEELLAHADGFIRPTLRDDVMREQWDNLRRNGNPPLWYDEILDVARHIGSVCAARPTMPSSGSSSSQQQSGTGSTGDSSSTVPVASAA